MGVYLYTSWWWQTIIYATDKSRVVFDHHLNISRVPSFFFFFFFYPKTDELFSLFKKRENEEPMQFQESNVGGPGILIPPCFVSRHHHRALNISRWEKRRIRKECRTFFFPVARALLCFITTGIVQDRRRRAALTDRLEWPPPRFILPTRVCVLCLHFESETMRKIAVRHLTEKKK
jgi:hypothetical protein